MSMRMRFVALIALTLVICVAWYAAAFKPGAAKLAAVKDDVKRTQDEVAALTAKLTELQTLKANEKELREEFERLEHALPVEPAVSDFILDVQDAADQAGIDFLSIAPAVPAAPASAAPAAPAAPAPTEGEKAEESATTTTPAIPPLQSIKVALTADGKFFTIEEFVAKMEKLERALRVDTFTLSAGGSGSNGEGTEPVQVGGSPKMSLTINLQIFMNRPATPAAPATGSTGGPATAPTTSGS